MMPQTSTNLQLADLLYPHITETPADVFARYPERQLSKDAIVTRFAPSPTGSMHIGSLYISLIGRMITQKTKGVFILRIEDTDQEREIEGGIEEIVTSLLNFGLTPDEGPYTIDPIQERGAYGPYQQTQRRHLYDVFAKHIVATGYAYPSFQTEAELEAIREAQKQAKVEPGYYGEWAKDRELTLDQVQAKLALHQGFALRYRATYPNPNNQTFVIEDVIRGRLEMPVNDRDLILVKSEGLPTYHFAHAIDDALMGVNLVLRGDEWLSTLPLHVHVIEAIGQPMPRYAHIAPIGKLEALPDGTSRKRKLSKRKDPEAAVSYYDELGYPCQALLEYLLNVANASFEKWRLDNPTNPFTDFPLKLEEMTPSIALFDLPKLDSISKDIIAKYSAQEVYEAVIAWARRYDPALLPILEADPTYSICVFNIEREGDTPRKDMAHWSDVYSALGFFFDPLYERSVENGYVMPQIAHSDIALILDHCIEVAHQLPAKDAWLQDMRDFSASLGFAPSQGAFKREPERYRGVFSDVMMAYRVALTNQQHTPDLYEIIQTMGTTRVQVRLELAKAWSVDSGITSE